MFRKYKCDAVIFFFYSYLCNMFLCRNTGIFCMYTKIRTFKIVQIGTIKLDRIKTRRSLTATNTDFFSFWTGRKTKEWQIMTEKSETVVFIQANSKFLVEISAVINSLGCPKHKIPPYTPKIRWIQYRKDLNMNWFHCSCEKKECCHNNDNNNKKQP